MGNQRDRAGASGRNRKGYDDLGRDRGPPLMPRSPSEMLEPARASEPPRRSKGRARRETPGWAGGLVRILNGTLTFMLMSMLLLGALYFIVKHQFDRPGPLNQSTVIVIPKGEGVNAIADRLQREGLIHDSRVFTASFLWFRLTRSFFGGTQPVLKAGEYEVVKQASLRQVLDTLVEGKSILYKVTLPEGLTSYQMMQILLKEPELTGEITTIPAEGALLPDTYRFSRGTNRQELIERIVFAHRKFVDAIWQSRAQGLPFQSVEEALVLASVVEKETGRADERDRIAGVFLNRLRKSMRLQSDPTIIYGITGGKGALGRPIRRSEIDAKNDYNTYQIDGLPPTPICNAGRAAIEAVLNPADTKDLFFVADGTGGHAFAETIQQHQKNVASWRKVEKQLRAEAKAKAEVAKTVAASAGATPEATAVAAAPDEAEAERSAGPGVVLDDMPGVETDDGATAAAAPAAVSVVTAEGAAGTILLPERKPTGP